MKYKKIAFLVKDDEEGVLSPWKKIIRTNFDLC
jgi:hypothetical protein